MTIRLIWRERWSIWSIPLLSLSSRSQLQNIGRDRQLKSYVPAGCDSLMNLQTKLENGVLRNVGRPPQRRDSLSSFFDRLPLKLLPGKDRQLGFGPQNNRRYSERHELEIVSLYVKRELSLRGIEKETGVPRSSVWVILERRGIQLRPRGDHGRNGTRLDPLSLARTIWLHEQGLTYNQIAMAMGLQPTGVQYRVRIARTRLSYSGNNRSRSNWSRRAVPAHVQRALSTWAMEDAKG